jgi:hypothetical protein
MGDAGGRGGAGARERLMAEVWRVHAEALAIVGEVAAGALEEGGARLEVMLDLALDDDGSASPSRARAPRRSGSWPTPTS